MPSLDDLAQAAGLSRFHFHRVFREATGLTPKAYATAERAARLRAALPHSATVTEAIYDAGYNSSSRFYSKSAELLGLTPTAYRAARAGLRIPFAVGQCAYGALLAPARDTGVRAILLGADPEPPVPA